MTKTIWYSIAETPWWVLPFFAYIGWLCYLATKPRLAAVKSMYSMPVVLICLSFATMCAQIQTLSAFGLALWVDMLLLGTGFGYLQYALFRIKAVSTIRAIYLPGTITPFIVFFLALTAKYYYGFSLVIEPAVLLNPDYSPVFLGGYGLLSGVVIGRLGYALFCLRSGPFLPQDAIAAT